MAHDAFRAGTLHTGFIDEHLASPPPPPPLADEALGAVAAPGLAGTRRLGPGAATAGDPFSSLGPWRLGA